MGLLQGHFRGLEAFVDTNFTRHLECLEGVHGLVDLASVTEIRCLLDSLLHLRGVLVDQDSESLLGFLGLAIGSLGLRIDDDLLGGHGLSRLLHNLLLKSTHLVVELHILVVANIHLRSHNLLLCLIWEPLTPSCIVEELVLKTRLATKRRLHHGWVNKDRRTRHQHCLLTFLPILVELSLSILVIVLVIDLWHLIGIHERWRHHLLLLLAVHIWRYFHLLLAIILTKLLLAPHLEFLATVRERAPCAVRTIAPSLKEFALHCLVVVCSVLEVALELHALAVEVLLEHHLISPSTVTSTHTLLHTPLILVKLLTREITTSPAVVAHAVLLEATAHVIPLLEVATHIAALGPVVDWHPPHGS